MSSSHTQTQHGVLSLSRPLWHSFLKFYSHCCGVCYTYSFKEIYLWVVDCCSLFISVCVKGHLQPNPAHVSLCLSVSRADSVPGLHTWGGRVESQRGPRRAHQGGTRQTWQLDDTCFCVSYHFNNHLHFIYVRLGTPTQSVRPVGLVRLRMKLTG